MGGAPAGSRSIDARRRRSSVVDNGSSSRDGVHPSTPSRQHRTQVLHRLTSTRRLGRQTPLLPDDPCLGRIITHLMSDGEGDRPDPGCSSGPTWPRTPRRRTSAPRPLLTGRMRHVRPWSARSSYLRWTCFGLGSDSGTVSRLLVRVARELDQRLELGVALIRQMFRHAGLAFFMRDRVSGSIRRHIGRRLHLESGALGPDALDNLTRPRPVRRRLGRFLGVDLGRGAGGGCVMTAGGVVGPPACRGAPAPGPRRRRPSPRAAAASMSASSASADFFFFFFFFFFLDGRHRPSSWTSGRVVRRFRLVLLLFFFFFLQREPLHPHPPAPPRRPTCVEINQCTVHPIRRVLSRLGDDAGSTAWRCRRAIDPAASSPIQMPLVHTRRPFCLSL